MYRPKQIEKRRCEDVYFFLLMREIMKERQETRRVSAGVICASEGSGFLHAGRKKRRVGAKPPSLYLVEIEKTGKTPGDRRVFAQQCLLVVPADESESCLRERRFFYVIDSG